MCRFKPTILLVCLEKSHLCVSNTPNLRGPRPWATRQHWPILSDSLQIIPLYDHISTTIIILTLMCIYIYNHYYYYCHYHYYCYYYHFHYYIFCSYYWVYTISIIYIYISSLWFIIYLSLIILSFVAILPAKALESLSLLSQHRHEVAGCIVPGIHLAKMGRWEQR